MRCLCAKILNCSGVPGGPLRVGVRFPLGLSAGLVTDREQMVSGDMGGGVPPGSAVLIASSISAHLAALLFNETGRQRG